MRGRDVPITAGEDVSAERTALRCGRLIELACNRTGRRQRRENLLNNRADPLYRQRSDN